MRTTLTLDDDVAAMIERLRRGHGLSLKEAVNRALRLGLERIEQPEPRERVVIRVSHTGRLLLPDVDDVWGVLDLVEPDTLP